MRIYAFMTGEKTTPESAAHGDYAEHGWIDLRWSRREFFDNRNYVTPVLNADTDDDDFDDQVRDALAELNGYEDNGDGTFYAQDPEIDYESDGDFTYALHFTAKINGPHGWHERSWHPFKESNLTGK